MSQNTETIDPVDETHVKSLFDTITDESERNYELFKLQKTFDIDIWYPQIRSHTFPTEFMALTVNQAESMTQFYKCRCFSLCFFYFSMHKSYIVYYCSVGRFTVHKNK